MPSRYKKSASTIDKWLSLIIALRLRQIEKTFLTQVEFDEKSGMSRSTMLLLRSGRGNPTLRTLNTLATAYGLSVWSLLGIREESARSDLASFGLPYDKIMDLLDKSLDLEEALIEQPPTPAAKKHQRLEEGKEQADERRRSGVVLSAARSSGKRQRNLKRGVGA